MEDTKSLATLEARVAHLEKHLEFMAKGENTLRGMIKNLYSMNKTVSDELNRLREFYYGDFPERREQGLPPFTPAGDPGLTPGDKADK